MDGEKATGVDPERVFKAIGKLWEESRRLEERGAGAVGNGIEKKSRNELEQSCELGRGILGVLIKYV